MARKIALTKLQASTIDILNTIRQNASYEYQSQVPPIAMAKDVPEVGEIICGNGILSNQFINALLNRIAFVAVKSAIFNNPYKRLKKGELEFGETIEEIFIGLAKVVDYDPEKAPEREFKRTIPDVSSAFHVINWKVLYPATVSDDELKQAFLSLSGMEDFISKIIGTIYTAAEYDEFLLFKYLVIKGVTKGKLMPISVGDLSTSLTKAATSFRSVAGKMQFLNRSYNSAGVLNNTPIDRLAIFMDADFSAEFDVRELAAAFNMDKADFIGSRYLIDDWTTFDNERWEIIRKNSTRVEEVTQEELNIMKNVVAVATDVDWFQIYDNLDKMKEKDVASGDYWNYFYHVRKVVSTSPFSNAVVFVKGADPGPLSEIMVKIDTVSKSDAGTTVITLDTVSQTSESPQSLKYIQTEALTKAGIGVKPYGALLINEENVATEITLEATVGTYKYKATTTINASTPINTEIEMSQQP